MNNTHSKEETILAKRFIDLSKQAERRDIVTFSDFLNLNELHIFKSNRSELYTTYDMSGGYECSERQMVAFLPEALCFEWEFPIICCKVEPLNLKFAEEINHRDVLGAIMHLGVERSMLGDILVYEKEIFVFCHKKIWGFLENELIKIKRTSVKISNIESDNINLYPKKEECTAVIASNRLDSLVAVFGKISRGEAVNYIKSGRVFVNHRIIYSTSYETKSGDIISIRKIGRFCFLGIIGETKKGRCKVKFEQYI